MTQKHSNHSKQHSQMTSCELLQRLRTNVNRIEQIETYLSDPSGDAPLMVDRITSALPRISLTDFYTHEASPINLT